MRKLRQTSPKGHRRSRVRTKSVAPRVFLSHASEDKERFVLEFATQLRQRGIDVWLDRWEMLPGDSLVDKIFEEGIAEAKAVIVVISKYSIAKPWVREELNAAFVKKVDTASKLIPVVIDDCKVPQCLQSTVWEKIDDLKNYEASLSRIVLSIFGQSDKPPLGDGPAFANKPVSIGNLTRVDSLVLQSACETCLEKSFNSCLHFFGSELIEKTRKLNISDECVWESVAILEGRGYLKHPVPDKLEITFSGFEEYLKACRPDYPGLLKKFASCVVNEDMWEGEAIARAMQLPEVLLEHLVDVLKEKGWIIVARYGGGNWEIAAGGVSPELKRWIES